MGSRRKLKSERELVADINKTYLNYCIRRDCRDCPYACARDCRLEYIRFLLSSEEEED